MNCRKTLALFAVAALVTLFAAGSAQAENRGTYQTNPDNWVHKADYTYINATGESVPSDRSRIYWTRHGSDSPLDANNRHLRAVIAGPDADGNGDFAEFYTNRSLDINKLVGDVNNLSYDERTDTTGAGAPRISVVFTNGDVAYLASNTCSTPITVGPSWSRADFTGATSGCSFDVSGSTSGNYIADGTHSAWDAYVTAHPNQRVSYTFLVFDEAGKYNVDRVSLGTNRLYGYADKYAVNCLHDESVC